MVAKNKGLSDERRQHLEHVQVAITRMASASSSAKTWFLPVIVATLGYSISALAFFVALLGLVATVVFAVLDSHYLREERAFRALYARAAKDDGPIYDMNSRQFYGKANGDDQFSPIAHLAPAAAQPWTGAYNPVKQNLRPEDIMVSVTITFPNQGMYNAFYGNRLARQDFTFNPYTRTASANFRRRKGRR